MISYGLDIRRTVGLRGEVSGGADSCHEFVTGTNITGGAKVGDDDSRSITLILNQNVLKLLDSQLWASQLQI